MSASPERPQQPARRTVLEPTRIMRRRRPRELKDFDDLFRPDHTGTTDPAADRGGAWEQVPVADRAARGTDASASDGRSSDGRSDGRRAGDAKDEEYDTEEIPSVRGRERTYGHRPWSGRGVLVTSVAAAGVSGLAVALLLTWHGMEDRSQAATPPPGAAPTVAAPTASAPDTAAPGLPAPQAPPAADPDGPGVLREGDSGPEVADLQERLLRIPNVYDGGSVSGTYDTTLTEAVGRFQLWYGIRGDETGVYGDDTRRDLESRTST
ncbi:hypothetical protein GCM10009654_51150 [Streptomyces hebeiensis]|uniref:Peptidoglycan binding-like domain-containing protein n=1 Tax=Streptomyces hebeiensis TaxID=229486 RepID=A0ABP4FKT3_9ACTN